jgi:hypothetical protein
MTIDQLINQLAAEGGAIVTSGECSEMEIADAQATGRFAVREDGIGFVRRYAEWLALQLEREKLHRQPTAIAADTDTPESDALYAHCMQNSGPMTGIRMHLKMQELERARDLARRGINSAINAIGLMGDIEYCCREERDRHAKKEIGRLEGYLVSPLNAGSDAPGAVEKP